MMHLGSGHVSDNHNCPLGKYSVMMSTNHALPCIFSATDEVTNNLVLFDSSSVVEYVLDFSCTARKRHLLKCLLGLNRLHRGKVSWDWIKMHPSIWYPS